MASTTQGRDSEWRFPTTTVEAEGGAVEELEDEEDLHQGEVTMTEALHLEKGLLPTRETDMRVEALPRLPMSERENITGESSLREE